MIETTIQGQDETRLDLRVYADGKFLGLDAVDTSGRLKSTGVNLPYEAAHALADWIIANVPKPEPKPLTLSEWAEMPIGAEFGFGKWGEFFPYVKVDEWTYNRRREGYSADIREGTDSDLSQGLTWRVIPLPTKFAAVVKSGGKLYTLADQSEEPNWLQADNATQWASSAYIQERGFEVIFAGVDD